MDEFYGFIISFVRNSAHYIMSTLSPYISDLLFLHNCVIIPGLGGFVSNVQSAEIDITREVVYPPHKTVVFNNALITDDGLLINYIAHKKKISYSAATEWIEREVKDIKHTLITDGLCVLDGMGAFYLDAHKKYRFKTDLGKNYLGDSYGLSTVKLPGKFNVNVFNKPKSVSVKNIEGIMDTRKKMMRVAAILLPIVGIAALIPFINSFFTTDSTTQNAAIGVKSNTVIVLPVDAAAEYGNAKAAVEEVDELSTQNREALYYSEAEEQFVYHIIAGSYNDRKHAQLLADKLNKEVASAQVIHQGLKFRVSYQQFTNRYEALKQLDFLRRTKDAEFWLHKVKSE